MFLPTPSWSFLVGFLTIIQKSLYGGMLQKKAVTVPSTEISTMGAIEDEKKKYLPTTSNGQ